MKMAWESQHNRSALAGMKHFRALMQWWNHNLLGDLMHHQYF